MSDKTIKSIICDSCEVELLEDTPYPAKYAIELSNINVNTNSSGISYSVVVRPLLEDTLHFCGFACLKEWMEKKDA